MVLDCLLVGGTGGGGEEVFLRDLVREPPEGVVYEPSWGSRDSTPGARVRLPTQVAFNRLVHPFLRPLPGLRAYRLVKDFDVLHVHNCLYSFSGKGRPPVVMTVGGGGYPHFLRSYLNWEADRINRLYRRASKVLAPLGIGNEVASWNAIAGIGVFSRFAADVLVSHGAPGDRIQVLGPGFPVPELPSSRWREIDGPLTVLFVGRDPRRKGADLVIEAVRRLRSEGSSIRAIFVGDPSYLGLSEEEGFEAHAWIPRQELYDSVYARAHVLALPARAEGFGFVAVEAMSFGLPVILSEQGAFPEILGESDCGFLVPRGEMRPVLSALRELDRDRGLLASLGQKARERFLQRFTRESHRAGLRELYLSALDGRS